MEELLKPLDEAIRLAKLQQKRFERSIIDEFNLWDELMESPDFDTTKPF